MVYPVPVSHLLTVENIDAGNRYSIYDLRGQLRCTGTNLSEGINVSALGSGEYILRITEDMKPIMNRKIIVLH